jgi:predicted RNase H-like HicB family nuclease
MDRLPSIAAQLGMVSFKIEKDGKEFHAWSPELPGCHTHGATRAEALANLKDAVRLYLDDVMEESLLPRAGPAPRAYPSASRRRA